MWDEQWRAVREQALSRDGRTCRNCPTTAADVGEDALHAHHVRPRADGGPDESENCLTLCEDCHGEKHQGRTTYLDVEFVQTVHGYGPMTTGEVADWIGCSRSTARRRLSALKSDGVVARSDGEGKDRWRAPRSFTRRVLDRLTPF